MRANAVFILACFRRTARDKDSDPSAGPPELTNDGVVIAGELSCLDFGLHVHDLSPFVQFRARAEARVTGVNERPSCGLQRAFLP